MVGADLGEEGKNVKLTHNLVLSEISMANEFDVVPVFLSQLWCRLDVD